MIQDNMHIQSLDVVLSLKIPENFVYPEKETQLSGWIALFSDFLKSTDDPDMLRLYNAYWKLFKIARSKAKLKTVQTVGNGEIIFTLAFKNLTNYSFFVKQVGHFTDNR